MLKPLSLNAIPAAKLHQKISPFLKHLFLANPMVTASPPTKRPTCPSCSKPATVCLCTRLRTPALHNSVAVTIFQHSLEKNHPLNSARIAKIGLKNLDVVTVSDVHSEARFFIRLLDYPPVNEGFRVDKNRHLFDEMPSKAKDDEFLETAEKEDFFRPIMETNEFNGAERRQLCQNVRNFNLTIARCEKMNSISNCQMGTVNLEQMSFDQLLASGAAVDEIRKGFLVKKLKMKEQWDECEEIEEFEIAIPCGSVLLFPSEDSVDVEAVDFEVKNMIVLDGTWAKAKRMYKENPWLRLLPHIRLNLDKLSLYSEVRPQPKAGYLSTIESIVYAMKAVGEDNAEGLDGLLDVFESMVGDQRRCKDERLSKIAGN